MGTATDRIKQTAIDNMAAKGYTQSVTNIQQSNISNTPTKTTTPTVTPTKTIIPTVTPQTNVTLSPEARANQVNQIASTTNTPAKTTIPTVTPTGTPTITPQTNIMLSPEARANQINQIASTTNTQTKAITPPVIPTETPVSTPTQNMMNLRDVATASGFEIGNVGNMPTINGQQVDPSKVGMQLVDGRWQGSPTQIATLLGSPVGLRESLESTGRKVEYNNQTGKVTVDGVVIDTDGMINVGGRLYTTQDNINNIITRTGGITPLNQKQELVNTDSSIVNQLNESQQKINELQQMIDEMKNFKIPQQDPTELYKFLEMLQQYKSPYDQYMKQILQETFKEFEYDPNNDPMLDKAIKYADRTMMEEMNRRGILSSTITTDNMRIIREDLLPRYQDMAFQKYNEQLNINFKRLEVLKNLDNSDYERYKNFITLAMETSEKISQNTVNTIKDNLNLMQTSLQNQILLNKQEAENKAEAYKNAWLKFKELTYVDNEISLLTGLPVGMRSKEAEKEILARYDEYNKLAIQFENRIDEQNYQYELDMKKIAAAKKEKDKLEEKKANAAKIYASLGNMSATDALNAVSKDFETLSDYLGPELWVLVEQLNKQKDIESKNYIERKQLEISQQNANTSERNSYNSQKNNTLSTSEKNLWIAEAARTYQTYPVKDAIAKLKETAPGIIAAVGVAGYKQVWDLALANAIRAGQAQSYDNYYKDPSSKTDATTKLLNDYNIDLSTLD